jgi:tetratricopeptide (TPR) repeat protein
MILLAVTLAVFAQSDPLIDGLQAYKKGDYAAAETRLRAALEKGDDARARAFLDLTLAATSRCDQACPGLARHAESKDAEIARLSGIALAQCHLSGGKVDEAAPVLKALRDKYPGDADVLYLSARLYNRAWNDTVYQLYQKNAASYRVNQMSGEVLETQGKFAEAAVEYRKAIEKNPKALNLHFRLGRALLMGSQGEDTLKAAQQEFDAELALNPMDAVAEYQVGQVLAALLRQEEAAKRMQRALELKPDFPEVLISLGKIRMEQKNNDEAIALLRKAVTMMPKSESARYSLMMAYRNAGRMSDARREKAELDKLQKSPEGEFTEFLKKLGEKQPDK